MFSKYQKDLERDYYDYRQDEIDEEFQDLKEYEFMLQLHEELFEKSKNKKDRNWNMKMKRVYNINIINEKRRINQHFKEFEEIKDIMKEIS